MQKYPPFKQVKPSHCLIICSILYAVAFTVLTLWKYTHFYYDNLDLAIFNNVFWNTLQGNWFQASIHPPSYLGDHFAPGIILLLPLYALAPRPETLLLLQTSIIAASVWPLYLIARAILGHEKKWLALFIASLWLINPIVHNMNFFEFELMAFAVFFFLWTIWAYLKGHIAYFALLSLLALSMREDFIFILPLFAMLAWIDRRSPAWKWFPLLTSLIWGYMAFSVIALFAPAGSYKFLRYYNWLGGTDLFSIATSFLMNPLQVLLHLMSWYNIEFILGMLFPFFFFILWKSRYTILLIPPTAQIMLAGFGGSALILNTYYAGYILVVLFVLFVYALKNFTPEKLPKVFPIELRKNPYPWYGIILLASLYSTLTYGSLASALQQWRQPHQISEKGEVVASIPPVAPVAATYELLAPLSSRTSVYLFPYAAIGKNQFALADYPLPANTEYLAIDWDDMVLMQMHVASNNAFKQYATAVPQNLKSLLSAFTIEQSAGSLTLLSRNDTDAAQRLARYESTETNISAPELQIMPDQDILALTIKIPHALPTSLGYFIRITSPSETFRIPLAYGLYAPEELAGTVLTMPLFLSSGIQEVTAALYSWSNPSIQLTGIKNLSTISTDTLLQSTTYRTTR